MTALASCLAILAIPMSAEAADDSYTANNGISTGNTCATTLYLPPYATTSQNTKGYVDFTLPDSNPDNGRSIGGYDFWPANAYFPGTSAQPSFSLQPGAHTLSCGLNAMDGTYRVWIDNSNPGGYAKPDNGIKISPGEYVTGVTYNSPAVDNPPTLTVPSGAQLTVGDNFNVMTGVRAVDDEDGNITSKVVANPSSVDTSRLGTTIITYTVTDSDGNTVTAQQTVTVTAKAAMEHTLTFDLQGGSMTDPTIQTVPVGDLPTRPADPTKENATFDGWYLINGTQFDFTQPLDDNITIFAKWNEQASIIACAPQTGDPGASWRQQIPVLACVALLGTAWIISTRVRSKRTGM